MPIFDSGVYAYVYGTATVKVAFPVDSHGNPYVRCVYCEYFSRSSNRCKLNGSLCEFPEKYIGSNCPLNFDND